LASPAVGGLSVPIDSTTWARARGAIDAAMTSAVTTNRDHWANLAGRQRPPDPKSRIESAGVSIDQLGPQSAAQVSAEYNYAGSLCLATAADPNGLNCHAAAMLKDSVP
jgi:hypothetical protein